MTTPAGFDDDPRSWADVQRFIRSGDRDDTAAFARALDAGETVFVSPRARPYVVTARERSAELAFGVRIPSDRRLIGVGNESLIHTRLPYPETPATAVDPGDRNAVAFFLVDWGARNVEFDGLHFTGDAPVVTPQNWMINLQMTVIELAWERREHGAGARDVRIHACQFSHHFGFTVHQRFGGRDIVYLRNRHVDCMNGVNLNGDHQLCGHNRFVRTEGFECTGSFGLYEDNDFRDVIWAFTLGGDQSDVPGSQSRSVVARRNTIDGVPWPRSLAGPPQAIVVGDNMRDVTVAENHVLRAAGNAINVHSLSPKTRPTAEVRILDNTLLATGLREAVWDRYPIYIDHADDVTIDGNVIADRLPGDAGDTPGPFAARAGIFVTEGGRGLRLGANEIHIDAPHYRIPDGYQGVEWIRGRPDRGA